MSMRLSTGLTASRTRGPACSRPRAKALATSASRAASSRSTSRSRRRTRAITRLSALRTQKTPTRQTRFGGDPSFFFLPRLTGFFHGQAPTPDGVNDEAPSDGSSAPPSGPVPERGHKEYVQPGTDTLKDPPIRAPAHLLPPETDFDSSAISQPLHSFGLSFVMIIFSEIGDKTFLIAALMAMKHPRILVFTAALSSLVVMSVLSAVLGHAVPALIPKNLTAFLAAGLFIIFGVKMIKDGLEMESGTANVQHEMAEVEAELQEKSRDRASSLSRKLEAGTLSAAQQAQAQASRPHALRRKTSSPSLSDSDEDDYASARGVRKARKQRMLEGTQNLAGLLLSPAWVQTFVMTFLGEWGDRSQIATIAMAAGQDYWYVTVGAISGHAICTGIAVVGGRMLASRISVRNGESLFSFFSFSLFFFFTFSPSPFYFP